MTKQTIESQYFKLKFKLAEELEKKIWNTVQSMEAIADHGFAGEIKITKNVSIREYIRNTLLIELREVHSETMRMVRKLSPEDFEANFYEIPEKLNAKGEKNARHSKV